ncbi:hypothetical protein HZH66_011883 [Vespula vulgaris]|uniref:Uncharacterized protein n=1 Tax=Vespula vulgaris TaxID=7454 RepID=A0A834JIE1_VESVU|nr:hypothetical protein HZH66_011883 [Vespula vulgaris]
MTFSRVEYSIHVMYLLGPPRSRGRDGKLSKNSSAADVISGARLENGDHVSLENSILARVATNRRRRRSTNPAPVSVRQRRFSRAATVES